MYINIHVYIYNFFFNIYEVFTVGKKYKRATIHYMYIYTVFICISYPNA
jgi:hypothetical protein